MYNSVTTGARGDVVEATAAPDHVVAAPAIEMIAISSALDTGIRTHQDIITRATVELSRCSVPEADDRIVAFTAGRERGMLNRIIART